MAWLLGHLGCGKQSKINNKYRKDSRDNTGISTHPEAKLSEIPVKERIRSISQFHQPIQVDLPFANSFVLNNILNLPGL